MGILSWGCIARVAMVTEGGCVLPERVVSIPQERLDFTGHTQEGLLTSVVLDHFSFSSSFFLVMKYVM